MPILRVVKLIFSIAPWLMDLINPPPRATLSRVQKLWRVALVTLTLVTLCVVMALLLSLGLFAWQRSRDFVEGAPQVRNAVTILVASILVNVGCIYVLLQVKKLDRRMIPKLAPGIEIPRPPAGHA